ncbi:MAG: hypothetical protein ACR2MK_08430 [Solirubrobacteraceae bacterium]
MNVPPPPESVYLSGAPEPVFATFHAAARGATRDTAVLLCPPFGWDEVCSYRSLRAWAEHLAQAGYTSTRLSFPGTGDSGGAPRDPDRLEAWTAAIESGARWLLRAGHTRRVTAIGLGLGGLLAYRAAAAGAPIDDLVLWAAPARGRALVRQLRAFSKLEVSEFFQGLPQPAPLPAGELEAGGFLLSAQTVEDLERLDLTALALPEAQTRRALLLARDGIAVDARLRGHLESSAAAVTVAPGPGYAEMTSHPQQARPALEVFARVTAWLDAASVPAHAARAPTALPPGASRSVQIRVGDAFVSETAVRIEQPFGALSGILVQPPAGRHQGLCAVLLNAGAVRRIGPSRMWVEAARRWAREGVATLRLDVEGIGDADGDETPYLDDGGLYVEALVPQVLRSLDFLEEQSVGGRFLLGGLCAGAYWAFHAALGDDRVCAAVMMNPRALIWDPGLAPARDLKALTSERLSLARLRRSATPARVLALARWLLGAPRRWFSRLSAPRAIDGEIDSALEQLLDTGKRGLLLFSEHEPLHDELVSSGRMTLLGQYPAITLERIQVRDHTLRPNWSQRQAHEALDRALRRELALNQAAPTPSNGLERAASAN